VEAFARALQGELDTAIPKALKLANASGFHICGFNSAGLPELWFVRNIGSMDGILSIIRGST
jgi:hypothetical protein